MSDRIKFRGWLKPSPDTDEDFKGEMSYPSEEADIKRGIGFAFYFDSGFCNDEFIFMLFTGHRDRNGVDIYEGDMLQDLTGAVFVVKPIIPVGGYCPTEKDWMHSPSIYTVVGNIYENPELLKEIK